LAVRPTTPFAGLVVARVVRWSTIQRQAGRVATWLVRPWYRRKLASSFADVLATLRQAGTAAAGAWARPAGLWTSPCPRPRPSKSGVRPRDIKCLRALWRNSRPMLGHGDFDGRSQIAEPGSIIVMEH
jgi:hypothetical protein